MRGDPAQNGKSIGILSQRPVKLRHKALESIGDLRRIEEARHSKESLKLPKIENRVFQPPIPEQVPLSEALIWQYPDRKDSGSTVLQKESNTQLHIAKLPNTRYVKPYAPSLPDSALSPMTASISQPKLQKVKYNPLRDTPLLAREQTQDLPQKITWSMQRDITGSRASAFRKAKLIRIPNEPAKLSINGEVATNMNGPVHTYSPKTINKYKSKSPGCSTPKRSQQIGKEAILYSNGTLAKDLSRAGRYVAAGGNSDINEGSALFTEAQNAGVARRQSQHLINYTPKAQSHFIFGGGGETPTQSVALNSHRSISLSRAPRRDTYQKWAVRAFVMRSKKTISDLN